MTGGPCFGDPLCYWGLAGGHGLLEFCGSWSEALPFMERTTPKPTNRLYQPWSKGFPMGPPVWALSFFQGWPQLCRWCIMLCWGPILGENRIYLGRRRGSTVYPMGPQYGPLFWNPYIPSIYHIQNTGPYNTPHQNPAGPLTRAHRKALGRVVLG